MAMNVDKGVIKSFVMLVVIAALVGGVYLTLYIYSIVGGTFVYTATNGTSTTLTVVTKESLTVYNTSWTISQFAHYPIISGTLAIYNSSDNAQLPLSNFTITYVNGSISAINNKYNNSVIGANYTYSTTTGEPLALSSSTMTFLTDSETSMFSDLGRVRTAAGFAGGLIAVAIILVIFAAFIKPAKEIYGKMRKNKGNGGQNLSY